MKAIGQIKITNELTLLNPTGEINSVRYDWSGTNNVDIEIIFTENNGTFKNSRTFTFNNSGGGSLTGEDVKAFISTHPTLKVFNNEESATWFNKLINFLKP